MMLLMAILQNKTIKRRASVVTKFWAFIAFQQNIAISLQVWFLQNFCHYCLNMLVALRSIQCFNVFHI